MDKVQQEKQAGREGDNGRVDFAKHNTWVIMFQTSLFAEVYPTELSGSPMEPETRANRR